MSDIEKEVVEGVAVAGGLYLLYRVLKFVIFMVILYFLVHYTIGWHRAIPVLENIFFSIKAILIRIADSLSTTKSA
jgi:hypothetical protein